MGVLAVLMHLTVAFAYLCDEASLVTLKKKDFVIANASGSASVSINSVKAEPVSAIVFYHLFVKDLEDKERVVGIVRKQLGQFPETSMSDISEIRMNSIGAPVNIADLKLSPEMDKKIQLSAHYAAGWEDITLHDLWSFCRERNTDPNQIVVYLHSKGSKEVDFQDIKSRQSAYLTTGAVSQECLRMPNYCNICSTRMSPLPYSQTPGNMWAARCGHVAQLKDPRSFDKDMLQVQGAKQTEAKCIGTDRYAAEHWVYSHPAAAPCDLDTNVEFTTAMQICLNPPKGPYTKELKKAPRFELQAYHYKNYDACQNWGETLPSRLAEYRVLYGIEPAADWWGWIFFKRS